MSLDERLSDAVAAASILIVDDEEANVALLESFLLDEGYTNVRSTTDSRQALPLFQSVHPDLVLLDLHMPFLDGFAVMSQLCAEISPTDYMPILVLTADMTPASKRRALSEGARDFLAKPLDLDEVSARIRNLLETRLLHEQLRERNRDLLVEREKAERLLLNVLPGPVADRLKAGATLIADSFPEATVVFADIQGFTPVSARLAPEQVVSWLNEIFSLMDRLTERHGLEKIKTVGDAYMVASGLPTPRPDHAEAAARLALAFREAVRDLSSPEGEPVRLRIGLHCGPVVAGVIGASKFAYDLWGDTVNVASRMQSCGLANEIHVSEAAYARLRTSFTFEEREPLELPGRGVMQTYFLTGTLTEEEAPVETAAVTV